VTQPDPPLISAASLADRLGEPMLRVVDCRWALNDPDHGPSAYRSGHIPGAIHLSIDRDLSGESGPGRHPLPTPMAFVETLARAGIGAGHHVVGYDDVGGGHAARLWWMLRSLGHEHTGLLDGGWQAWVAGNHPVATAPTPRPTVPAEPVPVDPSLEWPGTIDRQTLEARLGAVSLVDARAPERFRGEVEPIDPVAGHIPTAVNLPSTALLDATGRFLRTDQLTARFDTHLDSQADPVVVYCGSGVTACHDIFAMHLVGIEATLYPGSWSDWSTSGGEVATGPGSPPATGTRPPPTTPEHSARDRR